LAEASERGLLGAGHAQWYARLKQDFENLLGACEWGEHSADGVQASLELLAAMRPFLSESGQHTLGEQLLAEALARPAAQAPNLARCRGLAAWAVQLFFLGRYQESLARGAASLEIAIALDDPSRQAYALWIVAFCEFAVGNPTQARATFERALALARASGDETLVARALLGLAEVARSQGELERALALNEETLALHRAAQDISSTVITLANLTMTAVGLHRTQQAGGYLMQAIELADKMRTVRPRIPQLFCAAGLAAALHDWARAGRYHGAMLALAEPMNYHLEPADSIFVTAMVDEAAHALGQDAFAEAVAVGRTLSVEHAITEVRQWLRANASGAGSGADDIVGPVK
jgi:tetratricopeptide (TPR) repeat protein